MSSLEGPLPSGAVPDLSVDGTIELERLADVLYMGRPAFGQDQSTVGLFKVDAGDRRRRRASRSARTQFGEQRSKSSVGPAAPATG